MEDDRITEEVKSESKWDTKTAVPQAESKRDTRTTVPQAEVHLYVRGQGPLHVLKCPLGGWDEDRLDVLQIMDDYGLKALYAFNPSSGRGLPIRFNPKNGLSMLSYRGKRFCLDGEPKDSLIKPITKMFLVFALVSLLVAIAMREELPEWAHKFKFLGGSAFTWTVAIVVFVFSRSRKKLQGVLRSYGWL